MKFKIHRGANEIGGSCVEVWTDKTRILLDFGLPLVKDGKEFDFNEFKTLSSSELIKEGVLPDIKGLYTDSDNLIDGVIISHSHQDHYGLCNFINKNVKCYLGEATNKIIELNNLFTPQELHFNNPFYFEKEKVFEIGDISITPYWMDHSAFDSYSFLIEANGKKIFYSGDFRNHGRKANAFKWFLNNAPESIDYLLLEGTSIGRDTTSSKTETEIEQQLMELFKESTNINLIYTSGQNVDRLVSIYRACIRTDKIMVVDIYVATILKELSKFAKIPFPSDQFKNLRVIYPFYTSRRLKQTGNVEILYQFKKFKITKEEISNHPDKVVMTIRPSMQKDLELINGIDGGNIIYSMWKGYLQKTSTKKFMDYLLTRKFTFHEIHTSGHADIETLKKMVAALNPKNIIPIHTFNKQEYQKIFSLPVIKLNDGETIQI